MKINNRTIGTDGDVYIIAEMSANHGGDLATARKIIHAAKETGADAIKLQTYTADTITIDCDNEHFQIKQGTIWDGQTLHRLYQNAYTPWEWHRPLKQLAGELEIDFFSSPFDNTAVDFLEQLDVPAYKIASFEMNDTGLLKKVAATGRPVLFSTGMATLNEIALTVETLEDAGACGNIAMLKCTSAYPASAADMNLNTISDMQTRFDIPVGLSDHSLGIEVPVAATALGATIIEKHLTLDRNIETADSSFSLEPTEFAEMVAAVRRTSAAIGSTHYGTTTGDAKNRDFRRSLFVVQQVEAGQPFTEENVRPIRPGYGLEPKHLDQVIGRIASKTIERGTPLAWEHLESVEPSAAKQNVTVVR